jgi:flagellin
MTMASIMTNASALTALQTLKSVSGQLVTTQDRISTGLKVANAKDNASYFAIATTMQSDVTAFKAIGENLTFSRNAVTTGRVATESILGVLEEVKSQLALASTSATDHSKIGDYLTRLGDQIATTIGAASFNGENVIDDTDARSVVSGFNRTGSATIATTTIDFAGQDLSAIATYVQGLEATITAGADGNARAAAAAGELVALEAHIATAVNAAAELGTVGKRIEMQQDFISKLNDELNIGIGSIVDADMNEESTRLQALQVQQQLAIQALSIANQQPQNILSLFR